MSGAEPSALGAPLTARGAKLLAIRQASDPSAIANEDSSGFSSMSFEMSTAAAARLSTRAPSCKADAASAAGVIARVSHRASALGGGSQSSRCETSCGPSGFDEESALYALREEQLAEHTSWLAEQTS